MWDSVSGKAIICIAIAIMALFVIRILSKQQFKLIKPTWAGTQTQPKPVPNTGYSSLLGTDGNFRKENLSW